jgi:carbon-monoxide dehydrogenase large subunit
MVIDIPKTLADLPTSSAKWVGQSVKRVEDPSLLTGKTEFIDNVQLPSMLHCAILRSPHAHARIRSIDVSEAAKLPGVVAVVTGEDACRWTNPVSSSPEGWGTYCLAGDKVRFVGEPVAAVAATSRYIAEDALEIIRVEYELLPPVVDPAKAIDPDSALVFEEKGTNVMFHRVFIWGEVDAAFAQADYVFIERFRWHRMGGNPMETFGVVSQWDLVEESLTCRGGYQVPAFTAVALSVIFGLPTNKVRAIGHPHGGSFGARTGGTRGTIISALLSRKAGGRPVKYIEDRLEHLVSGSSQAWDRHCEGTLAVKKDGTVAGFRVKLVDNLGATGEAWAAGMTVKPLACFTGCYAIPAAAYDVTIVATNKAPQHAYRGYGPPPHFVVLEQLMDIAALGLGLDPAELRRNNFIPPDRFPYTIPSGNEYDSGNYEATLDKVLEMAQYRRLRREQKKARRQGRLLGIGIVSTIEPGVFNWNAYSTVGVPGLAVPEGATVSIDLFGKVVARVGFPPEGQGQYTFVSQLLADYFGVEPGDVRVVPQDSLSTPPTLGPGGSRQAVALTSAVLGAAERLKEKLTRVVAKLMEAAPADLEFLDGKFRVKGVQGTEMPLAQVAAVIQTRSDLLPPDVDPNLEATYVWVAPGRTVPDEQGRAKTYLTAANACHLVVVEVDPETGQVRILKYWIADDCGTRLNPAIVDGIIQGGVAQGVGAALLEEYAYDDKGQPLTGTFMDYLLPTIHEVPVTEKAALVTPSPFTALGAKGTGEGAIHTTPAAIICAINDAAAPLGSRITEVPATPNRLWKVLQQGQGRRTGGSVRGTGSSSQRREKVPGI